MTKITTQQPTPKEPRLLACFYSSLIVLIVSGLHNWITDSASSFNQAIALIHWLSGLFFIATIIVFTQQHIRRVRGYRQLAVSLSGMVIVLLTLSLAVTGLAPFFAPEYFNLGLVRFSHQIISCAFVLILISHCASYFKSTAKIKFLPSSTNTRNTLPPKVLNIALITVLSIAFLYSASAIIYLPTSNDIGLSATAQTPNYTYPYGHNAFSPSLTQTEKNQFVTLSAISSSSTCSQCHVQIAQEWRSSMHKQAASDPTYVKNISLLSDTKGIEATRYCEGCHAPIALLTGTLSPGGMHGGTQNTPAFDEGISCLSCHGIDSAASLRGVASFNFSPKPPQILSSSKLHIANNTVISASPSIHKQQMSIRFQQQPEFCATCHVQFIDKDMNGWGWMKMQDEYTAWLESPFSGRHNTSFAISTPARCQDCHMPLVASTDPARKAGLHRSHRFLGANTAIPFIQNDHKQLQLTQQFLASNKLRLNIDITDREQNISSTRHIERTEHWRAATEQYFYVNDTLTFNIAVSNVGVGHNFPGGTIDINEAWIEVTVSDAVGTIIYLQGQLESTGELSSNAYIYAEKPVNRQGKEVWRHDLFNQVGHTFRRVIKAGETDVIPYEVLIPAWVIGNVTINAKLKYRKFNYRYAKWALPDNVGALPITTLAYQRKEIEVRGRPPVVPPSTNIRYNSP